jgi:hypothetical protein
MHLILNIYSGLGTLVSNHSWNTPAFHYGIGVFQGDSLSVAIFDMVMNLYFDSLCPLKFHCAYNFTNVDADMFLSTSIYADDACIVTKGVSEVTQEQINF